MTDRRRPRGFTLVELLTVVAVIGVLLAVLLPALGSARRGAQAAACGSAIRQLQMANGLYANDHGGRYLPAAAAFVSENLHRWHGVRASRGVPFEPAGAPITPYLDSDRASAGVRACPAFTGRLAQLAARSSTDGGFERGCGGYGYNAAFVGTATRRLGVGSAERWAPIDDGRSGERRSAFADPAGTLAFADAAFASRELIEYSFAEPPIHARIAGGWNTDPSIHGRHGGEASVAWLDGSVTREPIAWSYRSGLYPADPASYSIGFIGADRDNRLFDRE